MIKHLQLSVVLFLVMWGYMWLARRYGIVDQPTKRTSHREPTLRGGGIIFLIAVVLWFFAYGWQHPLIVIGMLLISIVSFLDDIKSVKATIRIGIHLLAVTLLFYDLGLFGMHWYWVTAAYILTVGCVNAINFMDGINGITAFYSFITLGTFSLLNNANALLKPYFENGLPQGWEAFFPPSLNGTLMASILVFAFFNARPRARVFAGDVGSIGLAFIVSWLIINLMVLSHQLYWILFLAIYGVDTICTIMIRLHRRENIFRAHRLHLYQLLVNEHGLPHLIVAAIYAGIQLILNLLVIYLVFEGIMTVTLFIGFLLIILAAYVLVRYWVVKTKPPLSESN